MNHLLVQNALEDLNRSMAPVTAPRTDRPSGTRTTEERCKPHEMELIQKTLNGDRDAYYQLIQPYERAVYAAAIGVVGNSVDADDVAQEAFLKGLKHLHTFRMDCRFSTWLVQIAINEGRMRLRQARRPMDSLDERRPDEDGGNLLRELADSRLDPHQSLEQRELREALKDAIMSLPSIYREVFVLRDVDQLSIEETAEMLNISQASVKTRLRRARMKMQETLKDFYRG